MFLMNNMILRSLFINLLFAVFPSFVFADVLTANVQKLLNNLNLNAGKVDGTWGRKTEIAIQRFYNEIGSNFSCGKIFS